MVVTHHSGLTVAEVTDLRRQMREAGAGFKVTKNRLARLALEGTRFKELSPLFTGPTAIAYSKDPVAAAKVAVAYAKDNDKLAIFGGSDGRDSCLMPTAIKRSPTLPSLDELRASLLACSDPGDAYRRRAAGAGRPARPRARGLRAKSEAA